jgi:methylated-DNA-[protein]-cysteine S-methyltransferase
MIEHLTPPTAPLPDDALDRVRARAADEGLVDVAYTSFDTPVGRVVLAATPRGLARIAYEDFDGGLDEVLESLARRLSPRVLEAPARLDDVRRELDEYFAGRREHFDVPLDLSLASAPFSRRILEATAAIPFGATVSYRDVAERAGNARATRAAGNALGHNPIPIVVPCHRVLRTGGGLGGYTGGLHRKERLLALEGVLAVASH